MDGSPATAITMRWSHTPSRRYWKRRSRSATDPSWQKIVYRNVFLPIRRAPALRRQMRPRSPLPEIRGQTSITHSPDIRGRIEAPDNRCRDRFGRLVEDDPLHGIADVPTVKDVGDIRQRHDDKTAGMR